MPKVDSDCSAHLLLEICHHDLVPAAGKDADRATGGMTFHRAFTTTSEVKQFFKVLKV